MKQWLLLLFSLILGGSGTALAAEQIIENHSFGVLTAEEGKVLVLIQNEECVGHYKVAGIGPIVGEGKIDFRNRPETDIPLGGNSLKVLCISGGKLRVGTR